MIAKAKVISHGANAIRYSVDKDKAEIVKTNLLPDDISPTAMWARMLALQKKFEDKLNRYHPLKRNMIRIEVSPTSEETQGWTMEEWQRLADDFIREFDAVDLSAKSKRKSAKATNLKDSQYVVALHRDSKSGIMHLHIDANRIDIRGNVNDAHYIYERAMAAAAKVGQQRGWKDAQEVSRQNKDAITNDCLSVLAKMPYFDWGLYTKCLTQTGYDVKLQSDSKGQVRGYAIKRGNSIYKSSELGKGRCLMPSKIEGTWAKLHHQELEKPVSTPTKNTQQPKIMTVPKPMPTADNSPKIRHFDFLRTSFIIILLTFHRTVWKSSTRILLWMPTMCLPRLVMCKRPPSFSLLNTLMQPQPLPPSLAVAEVALPQVGDEIRTRMNCHGRIVAL